MVIIGAVKVRDSQRPMVHPYQQSLYMISHGKEFVPHCIIHSFMMMQNSCEYDAVASHVRLVMESICFIRICIYIITCTTSMACTAQFTFASTTAVSRASTVCASTRSRRCRHVQRCACIVCGEWFGAYWQSCARVPHLTHLESFLVRADDHEQQQQHYQEYT